MEKGLNSTNQIKRDILVNAAFQVILDNTLDMIFIKDINLVYIAASVPFVKMVGKESADEIINRTDLEIFQDENLAKRYVADDRKLLTEGKNLIDYIEPITDDRGRARYGSTSKFILKDENGSAIGILGVTRDITREYIARQNYQQELKYLFELPEDTYAVAYMDIDSWRIISQRRQRIQKGMMQSCHTVERLKEAAVESIVDGNCEAAEFYRNFTPERLREIYMGGRNRISFKYRRKLSDGSIRWVHNELNFLREVDSGHLCVMLSAKDIDAKKQEEQNLMEAAKLDKMTMLLNRETTMESIRKILSEEKGQMHALFMLDVDKFKVLNDTLGHQIGDEFLVSFAKELRRCFRDSDIVGRIGGDEFFALMKNIPGQEAAENKANQLIEVLQKIFEKYPGIPLSCSIGISLYPENGLTLELLYRKADSAMYQAKKAEKNQVVFAAE